MTNDWIEWHWTPEKPYPETLSTRVIFKFNDIEHDSVYSVGSFYMGGDKNNCNYHQDYINTPMRITHYKLA